MLRAAGIAVAIALVAAAGCATPPASPPVVRPNVLLVTIDTWRADRLGPAVTPVLDAVAARGLRFTAARTVAPLTLPAHASILTGLLPPAHGVRLNGMTADPGARAVAERLRAGGYRTAAVVGAFVLDRRFGLAHGFETYDDEIRRDPAAVDRLEAERPANVVVDRAVALLAGLERSRPWFVWVHLYDPHAPYAAPGDVAAGGSPYDAEVRFADAQIGRLLAAIDQRGDTSRTAIVVAGDHGEGLGEHGETTHGMLLFDATLRVPLVVAAPGIAPAVRQTPVSLVDIAPTIYALAHLPPEPSLPGRNLLASSDEEAEVYAETNYPSAAGWHPARALIQGRFKVVSSARPRLFDVLADPAEQHDLAAARPQMATAMTARVETLGQPPASARPASSLRDSETVDRLRALGYAAAGPVAADSSTTGKDAADHTAAWTSFEQALTARAAGQGRAALASLADLVRAYPGARVFQTTYAQALADAGRAGDALRVLREMVRQWPEDATLFHELAVVALATGNRDEATRAERAALTLDPELPAAHNGLGLVLAEQGDHHGAAAAFEQASRRDPSNGSYLANLGNARRALGDLDSARAAYEKALERDRGLADAANGLGVVLVQQGHAADAVPWFERALATDEGFVEAHLNLGIALQESGHRDRALAQYRRAEGLAPAGTRERAAARALRLQLEGR